MGQLSHLDYLIFIRYFLIISIYGLGIYYKKKVVSATSKDYFRAEGSLTWWAIGASLIASNISAEQFIGMSGSGFQMGLCLIGMFFISVITPQNKKGLDVDSCMFRVSASFLAGSMLVMGILAALCTIYY